MLTLTTINGRAALLIPMPKGPDKTYFLTLHASPSTWSVELEQPDGTEYTVWLGAGGQRQCSCKAFGFDRRNPASCKHCIAAVELKEILTAVFAEKLQPAGETW